MSDLITALVARQTAEALDDRQMARRLGIGATTWYMARTGRRPLTLTLIRAAVRTYPALVSCLSTEQLIGVSATSHIVNNIQSSEGEGR